MEFGMLKKRVFADCDAGYHTTIASFENVAEFVEWSEKATEHRQDVNNEWAGNERRETLHLAMHGDQRFVPATLDLLAEVDASMPPTSGAERIRSPYGGRVNRAEWLAGSPTPMRRRARRVNDKGEVEIYLSFASSASLDETKLLPRGATIMALIMKVQQYRPVRVWLYDETREKVTERPFYFRIGVDTQPLSLAHVGFAVSHPGFFRHLGLSAEAECGAISARWPVDYGSAASGYEARRVKRLDLRPEDVILSAAVDWHPLIDSPLEWIKSELQRIGIEE
jgi:hypothetical protein